MTCLLDTNVALLWILSRGPQKPAFGQHRRLSEFGPKDASLLQRVVGENSSLATTAAIATEISNLIGDSEPFSRMLVSEVRRWIDLSVPLELCFNDPAIWFLGFADTMTLQAASREIHVITTDGPLFRELLTRGLQATNFNHLRKFD